MIDVVSSVFLIGSMVYLFKGRGGENGYEMESSQGVLRGGIINKRSLSTSLIGIRGSTPFSLISNGQEKGVKNSDLSCFFP